MGARGTRCGPWDPSPATSGDPSLQQRSPRPEVLYWVVSATYKSDLNWGVLVNSKYRLLLLHSSPGSDEKIAAILEKHFENPTILFWEMGNSSTKAEVLAAMDNSDYNLIISYDNGLILKAHHLRKATYGSINIHPAPPEHGGCWGLWCQPVVSRDQRAFHGVTVHEIDELIDHGPTYLVERWEVPAPQLLQACWSTAFRMESGCYK